MATITKQTAIAEFIPLRPESSVPSAVLHRLLTSTPPKVTSAKGNYLYLSDGRKIFDSTGGAAVSCLGHGNERVRAAVLKQMDAISYAASFSFTTQSVEDLAQFLSNSTGGKMTHVFIVCSGSEAMEAALKLTRQYYIENKQPQRVNIISRNLSYHGSTLGALAVSGHKARRDPYEPILNQHRGVVSACDAYRGPKEGETIAQYVDRLEAELDSEFQRLGPHTVAAFIAEPMVGATTGCVPSVPGYFQAMRRVCDKYGALLLLDEIMSGMGRSGTLHAWEQEGVVPDLQTVGKGLGGGFAPISAVLIGKKVTETLKCGSGSFVHGQTYQAYPVSCAAALEVQKIIQEENLLENVRKQGAYLQQLLQEQVGPHPHVGNIRGNGLFWGLEFVTDKTTKEPFSRDLGIAMAVHLMGMEHGIMLYPGNGTVDGLLGDHVLLAPAYTITKEDVEEIVRLTASAVKETFDKVAL